MFSTAQKIHATKKFISGVKKSYPVEIKSSAGYSTDSEPFYCCGKLYKSEKPSVNSESLA
jgi:hypothetical protein